MLNLLKFKVILIIFSILYVKEGAFQDAECEGVADEDRVDCGVLGTEEEDCLAMNCCWEQQPEGTPTPWCYYRPSAPCLSSPCIYGTCLDDGSGGYECDCYFGYSGENCEELDESICSATDRDMCTGEVEVCYELGCCFDPLDNLCYIWAGGPRGPPGENCAVEEPERELCELADETTRMEECIGFGCCWNPSPVAGAYWCYASGGSAVTTEEPVPPTQDPECEMADEQRTECGYSGITDDICIGPEYNCCWGEPTNPENGIPWCFLKADGSTQAIDIIDDSYA